MADGYIDLSPIVNAIEHVGDNVSLIGNDLERVSDNIQVIDGKLSSTQEELADLRRRFEEYVEQAERTANVQRAETKVGTLKADLEREFGHYKVVRRSRSGCPWSRTPRASAWGCSPPSRPWPRAGPRPS